MCQWTDVLCQVFTVMKYPDRNFSPHSCSGIKFITDETSCIRPELRARTDRHRQIHCRNGGEPCLARARSPRGVCAAVLPRMAYLPGLRLVHLQARTAKLQRPLSLSLPTLGSSASQRLQAPASFGELRSEFFSRRFATSFLASRHHYCHRACTVLRARRMARRPPLRRQGLAAYSGLRDRCRFLARHPSQQPVAPSDYAVRRVHHAPLRSRLHDLRKHAAATCRERRCGRSPTSVPQLGRYGENSPAFHNLPDSRPAWLHARHDRGALSLQYGREARTAYSARCGRATCQTYAHPFLDVRRWRGTRPPGAAICASGQHHLA